ncbi:MAG: hypothetical protein NVSMB9_33380 [Isosphaeraceae bacterium]
MNITMKLTDLLPIGLSFAASLALTPAVRRLARHYGMVARPKADRWHTRPTALLGGVAIFLAVFVVTLLAVPHSPQILVLLGASTFLFAVGLVDDIVNLKPYQKLIGQIVGAGVLVACRMVLPWTSSPTLDMAITLVWVVGITNAVNLLDNMDGLAAGIAAIASGFLAVNFLGNGQTNDALLLGVLGAALVGFLVFNSNPASIFMGDCGSMFIGFFLAGAVMLNPARGQSRSFLPILAVPVLCLFVPIFDTLLVMVLRKLAGRSVARGGRDHTSHRLVTLGLSERRAVWMLYGLATLSGLLALLVRGMSLDLSVAAIVCFTTVLVLLGVHLGGVKVYAEDAEIPQGTRPMVGFLVDISYKRRIFEVLLDVVLIGLSYYSALVLVFGPIAEHGAGSEGLRILPVLVSVKIAVLMATGVYRGFWRYMSLDQLIVIARGVTLGSLAGLTFLLFAFRFAGFSRVVFVLDWLILLVLLSGSRLSFRLLLRFLPASGANRQGRRVLIYGAGDAGDLLARELLNNPALQCVPVGFADDDPRKKGKAIQGLRVLGGNGSFLSICNQTEAAEVLISSPSFSRERLEQIRGQCKAAGLVLRRLRIQMDLLYAPSEDDENEYPFEPAMVEEAIH